MRLNAMSLPDAAVAYAEMGIQVFPLQAFSSVPRPGWSWTKQRSCDPEVVRSWWHQWPDANIGLVMGPESGVDALDIDMKKGQDGWRSYQAICQEKFLGPMQRTPNGGWHFLFKHTPGLKNFTHKGDQGGLDMRTTNGYIVGTPSVRPEGAYQFEQDGPIVAPAKSVHLAIQQWSTQNNTETVEAPEIPEGLIDYHQLGLHLDYLNYLEHGDTSFKDNDESRALFATAGALQNKLQDASMVLGIMSNNPFAWECAVRHRPHGDVMTWLWKYGIEKIVTDATHKTATEVFNPLPGLGAEPVAPTQKRETVISQERVTTITPTWLTSASRVRDRASFAPDWIIHGLMEKGQVGLLYGDSQAFKSYMMLDMAASIAHPTHGLWHGHRIVSPGPTWFIAGEGNAILWRRLEALRQARAWNSDDIGHLWLSSSGLDLMDVVQLEYLRSQLEHTGYPPRVIFFDTMSTNAILDENNAKDCARLIQILHGIALEWGCTIILVHHVGKGNSRSVRGSSVLQANTDFRMRLERINGQRLLTQLTVEKLKGAPEPKDAFTFEGLSRPIVGVMDDEMVPVTDLVFELVDDAEILEELKTAKAQARLTNRQGEVFDVVKLILTHNMSLAMPGAGMFREEIWAEYRKQFPNEKNNNFYKILDKIIGRGLLVMKTEGDHTLIHLREGESDVR